MFPESPQLHHPLSHSHTGHPHYQLQHQLSPGDFRPRASSNASSIGRLSPIPAVPETENQDSPWSPEVYPSSNGVSDVYSQSAGGSNDRFNPDQLVDNIAESMKIRENGFLAPNSSTSTSSANGGQRHSPSNPSSSSSSASANTNGYGLCHPPPPPPPSYGSPFSNQQPDYRPLASSSSISSSESVRTGPSSIGRSPQQARIHNNPSAADVANGPPSYSMATLQVKFISLHSTIICQAFALTLRVSIR